MAASVDELTGVVRTLSTEDLCLTKAFIDFLNDPTQLIERIERLPAKDQARVFRLIFTPDS